MEEKNINKVIKEEDIIVRGENYKYIEHEDGTQKLKSYDEESKMWVTLTFAKEHDPQVKKNVIDFLSKKFLESYFN